MMPDPSGSMSDKPKRGDEITFDGKLTDPNEVLGGLSDRELRPVELKTMITDGGDANMWNQGGLFVAVLADQARPDPNSDVHVKVWFINNTIDPAYFSECFKSTFLGDDDVLKLTSDEGEVTFTSSSELAAGEKKFFLEIKSGLLLAKLSQHPKWGQPDGPNLAAVHEVLE